MNCPQCSVANAPEVVRCGCGYNLQQEHSGRIEGTQSSTNRVSQTMQSVIAALALTCARCLLIGCYFFCFHAGNREWMPPGQMLGLVLAAGAATFWVSLVFWRLLVAGRDQGSFVLGGVVLGGFTGALFGVVAHPVTWVLLFSPMLINDPVKFVGAVLFSSFVSLL